MVSGEGEGKDDCSDTFQASWNAKKKLLLQFTNPLNAAATT